MDDGTVEGMRQFAIAGDPTRAVSSPEVHIEYGFVTSCERLILGRLCEAGPAGRDGWTHRCGRFVS